MDITTLIDIKKDYKSAVSASALFWALSSFLVFLLKPFNIFNSYIDALPFVILVSWLAGEIAQRLPKKHKITFCRNCGWKIIPDYPFKKLWSKWFLNNCTICGEKLSIACKNNHSLSVISIDQLPEMKSDKIHCSRCGGHLRNPNIIEYFQALKNISEVNIEDNVLLGQPHEHLFLDSYEKYSSHELEEQIYILELLNKIAQNTVFGNPLKYAFEHIENKLKKSKKAMDFKYTQEYSLEIKVNSLKYELDQIKEFASAKLKIPEDELYDKAENYVLGFEDNNE